MSEIPLNREAWLTEFSQRVSPLIRERTGLRLKNYRVACGWPSTRGKSTKNARIGECWPSQGRNAEIFISPRLDQADEVAHVTVHELLHAALPPGTGHRKPFSQAAKKLGLEGKPTSTYAGEELAAKLKEITDDLGPYPHERIEIGGGPKQTTRLLKVMCPVCGYIARVTRSWIEEAGTPLCPQCDVDMEESEAGDSPESPLVVAEQTVEYRVKAIKKNIADKSIWDPRWSIRMNRKGREIQWFIVDFGDQALGVPTPRLTTAESRQDAIDLIDSLREGLTTYEQLVGNDPEDVEDDFEGELDPEADWHDIQFLGDDEEEHPDYEDGVVNEEEEEAFQAEQEKREAWVESEGCSASAEYRVEREVGSFQYRWTK